MASLNRFIPTCVGNTFWRDGRIIESAVHPHMRGEYAAHDVVGREDVRFIPTCVGNTHTKAIFLSATPVHPHMRGEYLAVKVRGCLEVGSSPHAWGIPAQPSPAVACGRFIPTCVGNTKNWRPGAGISTVHPHMRGEYKDGRIGVNAETRFIPTCVGNTQEPVWNWTWSAVHPHMRGEYSRMQSAMLVLSGSSPHAWGIPRCNYHAKKFVRFIPTCVGNTCPRRLP